MTSKHPSSTYAWARLREKVYERDAHRCRVCGHLVTWANYELGHMVERFLGGSDDESNVVVMHYTCNHHKPEHRTRAEAEAWIADGYWIPECVGLAKAGPTPHPTRDDFIAHMWLIVGCPPACCSHVLDMQLSA